MRRKILSLALLCALLVQLCVPAFADTGDTIYISDADDLVAFAEQCGYDAWSRGKTVILQRDISLGGVEFSPAASFGGTLDGGGHTISGLSISASVSPAGLFGTIAETGVVRNLRVEGTLAPSGSGEAVGGIAGVNRGRIEGCVFSGTVEGEKRVGGVAGENAATGTILRGDANGGVFGKNMTGGVAGANHGEIAGCANHAYVNTNILDPALSFDKLDLSLTGAFDSLTSPDTFNAAVDSGGIAGFSDGTILNCRNHGSVGYQHIGYNVGGIVGRSSGHVSLSTNAGAVYGRREVGGIAGMAEPYVKANIQGSSLETVRRQLADLSGTINKTVDDAEDASGTISARLTAINGGVDGAAIHAQALTDRLADTYDATVAEINRGSEILSETVGQLEAVVKDLIAVSETTTEALDALERSLNDLNNGPRGNAFEEAKAAEDDTEAAAEQLKTGVAKMREGLDTIQTAIAAVPLDRAAASQGTGRIAEGLREVKPALDALKSAMDHLGNVMEDVEAASADLQTAAGRLELASDELTGALRDADSLLRYLDAQEKLEFQPLGSETDAEADALYDSLRGVSDNIELLNREAKAASDALLEDVRQINRQFTDLMNTLLDVAEDVGGASVSALVEDTSDEDVDAILTGKLLLCRNGGSVNGDIDVGGVAGAMMVYNELDPENDRESLSSAMRRRYELKCILQDCSSTGAVSGKRDNVGAVCGNAALGVIRGCEGYGSASSESGDCVGGIAGFARNIVRNCWAKCSLSGTKYVGGIVGGSAEDAGLRVEDCRSLVEITDSAQYAGAISGSENGAFSGNLFVSDTLAGIDRVSYEGRAEPVSYDELLAQDSVPQAFRGFTLTFVADGVTVKTVPFRYGDSFDASAFPEIPAKEGKFARWEREDLNDLCFDTTVEAVYASQLTALGSDFTRSAARPAFFVEGAFDDASLFDAEPAIFDFDTGAEGAWRVIRSWRRSIYEQWQLTLPDNDTHTVRYLPAEGASTHLELYALAEDGGWTRLETGGMGSYLTFDATGKTVALTVVAASTPWWVWMLVVVFLLGAAALLVELMIQKRPKQPPQTDEEKAKLALRGKRRKKLRVVLIACVLALGIAVGAVVHLAPEISESMGLYRMVRNYAERSDLDLSLSVSARLEDEALTADLTLYTTQCEGRRVSCAQWDGVPVWFCNGTMLLENGSAYHINGAPGDYSELLSHAASLYRAVDIEVSDANGVRTYRASAEGEDARRVLAALLPGMADTLPESNVVELSLIVTDGELTSLLVDWNAGHDSVSAELRMLHGTYDHTLPQAVRSAILAGETENAQEIGEPLRRLLRAWMDAASRQTLTADLALKANCGPLLMDETLTWQRSRAYSETLCCLTGRGSALYYTDSAACTSGGFSIDRAERTYTDTAKLIRLACTALLLGDAECAEISGGWRYTIRLDADKLAEFAELAAPDTQSLGFSAEDGTVRLDIRGETLSAISIRCEGAMRMVLTDLPASVSARLEFDPGAAFRAPSDAVLAALELAPRG